MKKIALLLVTVAMMMVSGCASSTALIKANNSSSRSDVFEQISNGGILPPGYADLRISSSLKTHRSGIYSSRDLHGTSDYKLLVNIDGQAMRLQGTLHEEDSETSGVRHAEVGEGTRYIFNTKLRLRAGVHKVVLALPGDDLAVERQITLTEGSSNSLILEPVYRQSPGKRRPGFYGVTSYKEGIKGVRLIFNDNLS